MKSKIFIGILLLLIGLGLSYWIYDTAFLQSKNQMNTLGSKKIYHFSSINEYEQVSKYGKLPSFFEGTNMFTSLTDENGNLLISRKILNLFEYFFLALSEEDMSKVTGRIREYLQLTLEDKAAREALSIFEDYLNYRKALSEFKSSDKFVTMKADRTALFSELKALRRQYFKPEVVEAFFSDEEASIDYSLQRKNIKADASLSEEQKNKMLTELEEQLPERQRDHIRHEREKEILERKIQDLQASGGNDGKIYELRKEFYGEIIANQITFMRDSSPEWKSRLEQYLKAKEIIVSNPDLTDEEKNHRLYEQRAEMFTEKEQLKVMYQELKMQSDQKTR